MKISIIVTTYNRPDALAAVLDSLALQEGDYEVIVADDGSKPETAALIQSLQYPVRLAHIWQEDIGFRAAAARNRAAADASGDYLIFLDGDCMVFADFCTQHRALAKKGWAIAGNRILAAKEFSAMLLKAPNPARVCHWSNAEWKAAQAKGDVNKATANLRLALGPLRKLGSNRWQRVRTCNLGVWRSDFIAVNGFDEDFQGWGYEDSDFAVRLIRSGIKIKDGRFAVPVLHLWHQENDRTQERDNWAKFEATLNGDHIRAKRGLDQYL